MAAVVIHRPSSRRSGWSTRISGSDYSIPRATRNILFDEKLGGTVHLAVVRSYARTGGKNESSVHWGLICDLREGGELLQSGGRFRDFDFG